MIIKKKKGTYNDYDCQLSFGQLQAIKDALARDHADPLSDELYAELEWYLQNVPGPGEDEQDIKAAEEAGATGLDKAPASDQQPLDQKADQLLPAPGEEEMGEEPGAELGEEPGGEPEFPGEELGEEPGMEEPPAHEEPVGAAHHAERRIPAPPEE